jgi:hypothetical protein
MSLAGRDYMSFTVAMTMLVTTRTTIATCIQIHVGDMSSL